MIIAENKAWKEELYDDQAKVIAQKQQQQKTKNNNANGKGITYCTS